MIKRVEIEGFKSFMNKTILDFEKTKYTGLESNNVFNNGVLKGAVFFGSNASGKSTILHAINFLFRLLVSESYVRPDQYFCIFAEKKVIKIKYEFAFGNDEVEYLLEVVKRKKSYFFNEDLQINKVQFMSRTDKTAVRYIGGKKEYYHNINPEVLFLRSEYFNKGFDERCIKDLFEFANNSIYINMFRTQLGTSSENTVLLRPYLEKYGASRLNKFLKDNKFIHRVKYLKLQSEDNGLDQISSLENNVIAIERTDVPKFLIDISMESDGVSNLFNILPSYLTCIEKGAILLIDEFCSGFHNELEELLIRYFFKESKKSQMFVVTHSTNVLSNTLYRPDQMFKIDFIKGEGSSVYRVSSSQPRPGQNIEKMYLGNAFGISSGFIEKHED